MKRNYFLIIFIIALIGSDCSSSKENTGVWVNKEKFQGKKFNKLYVLVLTADIQVRNRVESDLADFAKSRGYPVEKSIDLMKPSLSDPKPPTKEEIVESINASGCDAVLIAALLKKDENMKYNPTKEAYSVMPYQTFTGNYIGYYNNLYTTVYEPGYYSNDKSYFMQSNLYDAASQEIMWAVQSKVFQPEDLENFSKTYVSTLVKQLEKEELLRK